MASDDEIKNKVTQLFSGVGRKEIAGRRVVRASVSQTARGNNNIQAAGDVHVTTPRVVTRPRIVVHPGTTNVSAEQKAKLQALVKKWVELSAAISRGQPVTFASAWAVLNKKMRVNSYAEISYENFDAAHDFLTKQIAVLNRKPSARRKSPTWRTSRIAAIQSRCNERGYQDRRRSYMRERLGVDSMTKLNDADLEKLYGAVFSW